MAEETKKEIIMNSKEEEEAKVEIWQYALGFTAMAVVKCAIELGIADVLENHKNPVTLAELSSELNCSPSPLHRIMRFLIHRKIFKQIPVPEGSVGYVQTPLSRLLARRNKYSMADFLLLQSSSVMMEPWHKLSARVLDGEPPFEAANGDDVWQLTAATPEHSKLFDDGMACDARMAVGAVVEGCPEVFEGLSTLVDVGGGDGTALRFIVEAFPRIKGINFDLPHVVSVAPKCEGVQHVGGSMFDHVPNADAVFMMKVLHDWGDEECIDILRKCREAIPKDKGKVIIIDSIIEREEEDEFKGVGLMIDMVMMAHTNNGKERTLKEWSYVIHEAGFTSYTVKHIRAYQSVIEAYL